jgi:hypothetical protein
LISVLLSKILCQEMPEDVFLKALKHYSFIWGNHNNYFIVPLAYFI